MAEIKITIDDELIDRIAFAVAQHSLANAGMLPGSEAAPASSPQAAPDDPWDDAWPDAPGTPGSSPETASEPARRGSAPGAQGQQQSQARQPSSPRSGTFTVDTPKGQQRWTLGADSAPLCLCGEPAGYVQGKTNGRAWKRWACAKGSGDDWRDKCGFSEWA